MKIIINTNQDNYIRLYLLLWKSALKLTDAEIILLEAVLKRYNKLKEEGIKDEYLPDLLFNTKARKELQTQIKYSQQQFNNIVKTLKDKKIILPINDTYIIKDKRIIPVQEITFKFNRTDDKQ